MFKFGVADLNSLNSHSCWKYYDSCMKKKNYYASFDKFV